MIQANSKNRRRLKCAIYTRKSSEEGLEQSFNSLHAQREACEAYIKSQCHEGWVLNPVAFDDGGYSGGNMDRPALNQLIVDIKNGCIDIIVVYKVDRLSRSLADFSQMIDLFDKHGVSFVSVTQQFNTSSSMGRLTLNVLLSFAQFEREVTSERIRDKIAASKKKGIWMGGFVPLGYDVEDKKLIVSDPEAETVRHIYDRYLVLGCVRRLKEELDRSGYVGKSGGKPFSRGALYCLLKNPLYIGKVKHKGKIYDGQHAAIVKPTLWKQVQTRLAANKARKALKVSAKDISLLTGLLFDDRSNPMSPTHATKKNKRYRYYISQALLQYREQDAGSVIRISAKTIEDVVTSQLKALLNRSCDLLDLVAIVDLPAEHQRVILSNAEVLADTWDGLSPSQKLLHMKQLIERIEVGRQEISVTLSRIALLEALLPDVSHEINSKMDEHVISIPAQLKRCGIETRLIVPNEDVSTAHHASVRAIQNALVKALEWNQALITGSASSMNEIAKKHHVTQRYVSRLIKMAFLAPDIMAAIGKGNIPLNLSMERFRKSFPFVWDEQRKALGFPPSSV